MSLIKIEDIAHVRFHAPDLAQMRQFLEDFGFSCFEDSGKLYGKGSDGRPFLHVTEPGEARFAALGLRATSLTDLKILATHEKVAVETSTAPGGGHIVRLTDPDGYVIEVVCDQASDAAGELPPEPIRNSAGTQARLRSLVRLDPGPSHIRRIGHAVLNVTDFRTSEAWYKERFGFLTSDEVQFAPGMAVGAFMRCDRGERPSDHHTVFLAQLPQPLGLLHAAFEVACLDDLMLGHSWLKDRNRESAWGVGRHIMGSQIFDYWRDPFGNELEHWTDGDLLTADDPPVVMPVSSLLAVQWGADHPMTAANKASQPSS